MWGYMGDMGWGGGWGLLGIVHMVLWWALIVLGIAVLVKWLVRGTGSGARADALDILRERYARGEIGKDEFEQKKLDLTA
jgi:putative membrane protein